MSGMSLGSGFPNAKPHACGTSNIPSPNLFLYMNRNFCKRIMKGYIKSYLYNLVFSMAKPGIKI